MLITIALFAALLVCVRAFTYPSRIPVITFRRPSSAPRLFQSSDERSYGDDDMPFYALGTNLASQAGNVKSLLDEDELEIVLQAFCENMRGTSAQDANEVLTKYGPRLNQILQERAGRNAERERQAGRDFAETFCKENPTAVTTDSGLVYLETRAGTGESPTMNSVCQVHYVGSLRDGTVVDSSVARGEKLDVALNQVTKGWAEGLQLMKEGGRATLILPDHLAYGENGSGDVIPPCATLQFEIELFKVTSKAPEPLPDVEMDEIALPDGQVLKVPKGVKARLVDESELEN